VHKYGWDPNEVDLIRARAILDYQQFIATNKSKAKTYWQIELSIVAAVIILILFIFIGMRFIDQPSNVPQHPKTIREATDLVRVNLRDVNFDGKLNCIDYAVVFYEIWPDATIIRAWDNKDFNHLLNKVGDKYIEPQTLYGDPNTMWTHFDATFKRDETLRWGYWATRRRW
jgi:hypothetical protein